MLRARLKLKLALEQIAHTLHDDLDERHAVFHTLGHYDGRVNEVILLFGSDGLPSALHIARSHTSLQVDGGSRHSVVDVDICRRRHVALEVLSLHQTYREFAHDVLEGEVYGRCRSRDALACGKEQVAGFISAQSSVCLLCALVETHAERLVFDAAHSLYVGIVSIGIICAFVPVECALGGPVAAVIGQSLIVHQVAAYLQSCIRCCHIETYLVALLEVRCRSTALACSSLSGVAYSECHRC